jgi:hypothetical protein
MDQQISRDEAQAKIDMALTITASAVADNRLVAARDFVQQAIFLLDDQANAIKSQIELARGQAASGRYSDSSWWARVNGAARHKGRERQQLQLTLGELSRRIRKQNANTNSSASRSDEQRFIAVAKAVLPSETYNSIWQIVKTTAPQETQAAAVDDTP